MIWIIAGMFLAICVLIVDSKFYVAFAYHIYVLILLLLVAVLFWTRSKWSQGLV